MVIDWILPLTVDQLKEVGGKCSSIQGTIPISSDEGRSVMVVKEPYGVTLGIAPWFVLSSKSYFLRHPVH